MRILICQINPIIGSFSYNLKKILQGIKEARVKKCELVIFPEAAVCGYPPNDFLYYREFLREAEKSVQKIADQSKDLFIVLGTVRENPKKQEKHLLNTAAIIENGKLVGYKDKILLPDYDVFNERRYFEPGDEQKVFAYKNKKIGVLICEDVWQHSGHLKFVSYARDPVLEMKEKIDIAINISASPYYFAKTDVRKKVFSKVAKTLNCPVIFCNQVGGNDQLIFDGNSFCMNAKGEVILEGAGFQEEYFVYDTEEKLASIKKEEDHIQALYNALVLGVRDYFSKQNFAKACIGISGGIDSALSLCIAVDALGAKNIIAVNMPSRFSSLDGIEDAHTLCENLSIGLMDIPIDKIFQDFLNLLIPSFQGHPQDTAEENLQARIRGTVLMALSNKLGAILLSTGNKSEMAMGYVTLYGDMCGGVDLLGDVTKSKVYELSNWVNRKKNIIPQTIIKRAPSAELKPNQKDQDDLPEYAIVDKVLEAYVEEHMSLSEIASKFSFKKELVRELIERIHKAEYKRRQAPLSFIVSKTAFSRGRVFPIVQRWA